MIKPRHQLSSFVLNLASSRIIISITIAPVSHPIIILRTGLPIRAPAPANDIRDTTNQNDSTLCRSFSRVTFFEILKKLYNVCASAVAAKVKPIGFADESIKCVSMHTNTVKLKRNKVSRHKL